MNFFPGQLVTENGGQELWVQTSGLKLKVPDTMRSKLNSQSGREVVFGGAVVLVMLLLPDGFAGLVARLRSLAARSYATLARYVLGFALQLSGHESDQEQLSAHFHKLDPQMFPATHTVANYLPVPLDEEFALGLKLIVEGLAKMRRRPRR